MYIFSKLNKINILSFHNVAVKFNLIPNVSCKSRRGYLISRFDVGVTWTRILDGNATVRSQWLLSLRSVSSGLNWETTAHRVRFEHNVKIQKCKRYLCSWSVRLSLHQWGKHQQNQHSRLGTDLQILLAFCYVFSRSKKTLIIPLLRQYVSCVECVDWDLRLNQSWVCYLWLTGHLKTSRVFAFC